MNTNLNDVKLTDAEMELIKEIARDRSRTFNDVIEFNIDAKHAFYMKCIMARTDADVDPENIQYVDRPAGPLLPRPSGLARRPRVFSRHSQ